MLGTLLIVGAVLLGGWCFFMGPCKGWLSGGGRELNDANLDSLVGDKTAANIIRNAASGKISMEEAQRQGAALRQKYSSNYVRLSI